MNTCNPYDDISALLCDIPFQWRDALAKALACIMSYKKDRGTTCADIKNCESLTALLPIEKSGDTITFKYKDEKGIVTSRSFSVTDVVSDALDGVDPKCLMSQEEWDALSYSERLSAIFNKSCCVYTSCCECDDCDDCQHSCECKGYFLQGTPPFTVTYKDCDTKLSVTEEIAQEEYYICAMKGSITLSPGAVYIEAGNCGDATTTTTTSSTTTTTTEEPTTTTTTTSSTTTTTTEAPATTTTTTTSTTTTTTEAPVTTTTTTSTSTTTTETTTTSTTTTTTAAEALSYYLADEYDCGTCLVSQSSILVEIPTSHSIQLGKYYQPIAHPSGFVYYIINITPQPVAPAIALSINNFTTCGGACV